MTQIACYHVLTYYMCKDCCWWGDGMKLYIEFTETAPHSYVQSCHCPVCHSENLKEIPTP